MRAREDVGGASRFGNEERMSRFRIARLIILRRGGAGGMLGRWNCESRAWEPMLLLPWVRRGLLRDGSGEVVDDVVY